MKVTYLLSKDSINFIPIFNHRASVVRDLPVGDVVDGDAGCEAVGVEGTLKEAVSALESAVGAEMDIVKCIKCHFADMIYITRTSVPPEYPGAGWPWSRTCCWGSPTS